MKPTNGGTRSPPNGKRYNVRWMKIVGLMCVAFLVSSCTSVPNPRYVDCSEAEVELRYYTERYFSALEDIGNLRQELKAARAAH